MQEVSETSANSIFPSHKPYTFVHALGYLQHEFHLGGKESRIPHTPPQIFNIFLDKLLSSNNSFLPHFGIF